MVVTLLWNDLPTSPVFSIHSRHFINVLLYLYGCNKCSFLSQTEWELLLSRNVQRLRARSTLTSFSNTTDIGTLKKNWVLLRHSGKKVQKLPSNHSWKPGSDGKRWDPERHMTYNFKEMNRQRHLKLIQFVQDGDLLLDVERSDLLSIQDGMHGHKILFGR